MSLAINETLRQINNGTSKVNYDRGQKNLGNDRLDKQAFLQLLMAKLQFQDPLNPVQDNEFLSQQTQLAQVEKLDDLTKALQTTSVLSQASSMVGKQVEVLSQDGKSTLVGTVQSASISNGAAGLNINGQLYTMDQVKTIYGGSPNTTTTP